MLRPRLDVLPPAQQAIWAELVRERLAGAVREVDAARLPEVPARPGGVAP